MIIVTRLRGVSELYINAELIETVEATPDTVITFTNGNKLIVNETPAEVAQRVLDYKRSIYCTR